MPTDTVHEPVALGQLWQLGPHRVLCGDSTNARDVGRLFGAEQWRCLSTSPPYLALRDYTAKITDWQHLAIRFMETAMLYAAPDSDCLVNLGLVHENRRVVRYWEPWLAACEARGWPLFGWYVWDKLSGFPGNHFGRLAPAHEWLFHFQQGKPTANAWVLTKDGVSPLRCSHTSRQTNGSLRAFTGPGRATKVPDSVLRAHRNSRQHALLRPEHPATQGQEFIACILLTWSAPGDLIFDPFGGSGQTLLTAHGLGRRCVTMDISPQYVSLMLSRWQRLTGDMPQRLM